MLTSEVQNIAATVLVDNLINLLILTLLMTAPGYCVLLFM